MSVTLSQYWNGHGGRCGVAVLVVALMLARHTECLAYDVNKDLKNLGPAAHDVSVILSGTEDVYSHFDGYSSGPTEGRFGTFATGPDGPNTRMKWDNFKDSRNQSVDTGQTIHIGWSTSDHSSNIKDMFWTDPTGQRIPGSVILNLTSGWRYETSGDFTALFENSFESPAVPIADMLITDLQYTILPEPIPLADLNGQNPDLFFQPVPGAEEFVVPPQATIPVPLLEPIPLGAAVVLRYEVHGEGSMAESLDFVQIQALLESVLECDLNNDGWADAADAAIMFSNWGGPGAGDCNRDGIVDAADAGVLFTQWSGSGTTATASVPEPSHAWLAYLGVSAVAALRRRCG